MPLTQEQEAELIRAIKSKAPNNIITAWLTETCGVPFQESFIIRRKIFEKLQDEKNTEQKESIEDSEETGTPQLEALSDNSGQEGSRAEFSDFFPTGYRKIPAKKGRRTKKEKLANFYGGLPEAPSEEVECAECGDPTFQCSCPCQRQSLIAF